MRSKYGEYKCSVLRETVHNNEDLENSWSVMILKSYDTDAAVNGKLGNQPSVKKPKRVASELELSTTSLETINLYTFPSLSTLSGVSEEAFREMGYANLSWKLLLKVFIVSVNIGLDIARNSLLIQFRWSIRMV